MYRPPSYRKHKGKKKEGINLIPILDSVFIFIFFLLMSANFLQVFEISSDVPIVSDSPPPDDQKKPLALTVAIDSSGLIIMTGVPAVVRKRIPKMSDGKYDYQMLHDFALSLKKNYLKERTAIIEPKINVIYEEIVKVMDAVRTLRPTDESLFIKDKSGISVETRLMFDKIVFANIL